MRTTEIECTIMEMIFGLLMLLGAAEGKQQRKNNKIYPGYFQCLSTFGENMTPLYIPDKFVCDGWFQCKDLSDEYLCPLNSNLPERAIRHYHKKFAEHMAVTTRNISEFSEEYLQRFYDPTDETRHFTAITLSHYDCRDKNYSPDCGFCEEGEILCPDLNLGGETLWYDGRECLMGDILMEDVDFKKCVKPSQLCDRKIDCKFGEDEMFCQKPPSPPHIPPDMRIGEKLQTNPNYSHFKVMKAKSKVGKQISCKRLLRIHLKFQKRLRNFPGIKKLEDDLKYIDMNQICDGQVDCENGIDELHCPGRFYCESGSVKFVELRQRLDGTEDCADGSDEWSDQDKTDIMASHTSMIKYEVFVFLIWFLGIAAFLGNIVVIFTSLTEIASLTVKQRGPRIRLNIFLKSIVTVSGKFSFASDMGSQPPPPPSNMGRRVKTVKLCNLILVLNLALSDCLMASYLISLGVVKETRWSDRWKPGQYWKMDTAWRTSEACMNLGVIVMTASTTSLYTLFGMTTLRLQTVIWPFSDKLLKPKVVTIYCLLTWALSICLSHLPLLKGYTSHYSTNAWVPLPYFKPHVINKQQSEELVRAMANLFPRNVSLADSSAMTWRDMRAVMDSVAPVYADWKYFGFYSAHSVCMPKLFVEVGEMGWHYTVFFLSVNFTVAVYISATYLLIYFKTKQHLNNNTLPRMNISSLDGSKELSHTVESGNIITKSKLFMKRIFRTGNKTTSSNYHTLSQLQTRIAVLVCTDCACWLPICIMCFLKLGGVDIPPVAYQISAIILLPINSALNPVLHSRISRNIFQKIRGCFSRN